MSLNINRQSKTPIYVQLKNQIIEKITSGEWHSGYILPSERTLSESLGVNRSTVNKVYWELKAEGFLTSKVGSGTLVSTIYTSESDESGALDYVPPPDWHRLLKRDYDARNTEMIKRALEAIDLSGTVSFAGGFAGPDVLPFESVKSLASYCLDHYGARVLSPTGVLGLPELRKAICHTLPFHATSESCMILSGSQQGVDFVARALIQPGDLVFTEAPTYIGAIESFKAYQAKVVGIPIDKHGMRLDVLENYLKRYHPKLIYVTPTFQNPSGTNLSLERRERLLELAYLHQIPIVEDDPYSDIRFEKEVTPTLKSLDRHGYVIYISTFSKKFYMGGRVGWVIADAQLIKRFGEIKQITDLHVNTFSQYILYEAIHSGKLKKHIRYMTSEIEAKCRLMASELKRHQIEGIEYTLPKGGFYIWMKLPDTVNPQKFYDQCKNLKVAVMPGDPFFPEGGYLDNYVRINYSYPSHEEIIVGVERLAKAVNASRINPSEQSETADFDNLIV